MTDVVRVIGACYAIVVSGLYSLIAPTAFADANQVVINEIMYHPPADLEDLQFIELFNAGTSECDLAGWRFTKGVDFVFPDHTKLAPGKYLVVCRDPMAFVRRYGKNVTVAGRFKGKLSHGGERVELSNAEKQVVDIVKYADSAPWSAAADGHSPSLERICPTASGDDAANWAASRIPDYETPMGTPGRRNDSYLPNLPPVIREITLTPPRAEPDEPVLVDASVADDDGVATVEMTFQVLTSAGLTKEKALEMERVSGDEHDGHYQATLPGQPWGRLVRYQLKATDQKRFTRTSPGPHELRGAWSYSTFTNRNSARIPVGYLLHPSGAPAAHSPQRYNPQVAALEPSRGTDAFIYMPADGGDVQTFDFIQTRQRKGGYKVHFLKDQALRGMTAINIIFEFSPRFVLAEALSYDIYRLAGVPAELTEHIRLWADGKWLGYQLLIEQPNKAFLARNKRNTDGNLYKLIWYGNGIVGQHEKKTNVTNGHGDLLAAIDGINAPRPQAQWEYVQSHFNVDEFASYYAVNMCIQNWDGFHNNYFVYHDTQGTGRWEIYPWDEDKTWGDYDGASRRYDWYEMPLTYGMLSSQRPASLGGPGGRNPYAGWWRAPGLIAGPLLSNPVFRERFLRRLREVVETDFTEEKIFPLIDAMEKRLEGEIPLRAKVTGQNPVQVAALFRGHLRSFRDQVVHRRKFILDELNRLQR